ncbi:MAG: hypothetical protein JOS17DRAFT_779908 [Linnemannia elongata]|nr:MAG: hypothetical protein JOS17DRAFT_779908 [Linnemannia elongata]
MPANTLVPFISEKDKRFFVNTMDGSVSRGISLLELMVQTTQPANSCMNGRKAKQTAFVGQRPSGFSCTCLVGEIKSLDATPFPVLNYFDRPLAITLGKALLLFDSPSVCGLPPREPIVQGTPRGGREPGVPKSFYVNQARVPVSVPSFRDPIDFRDPTVARDALSEPSECHIALRMPYCPQNAMSALRISCLPSEYHVSPQNVIFALRMSF